MSSAERNYSQLDREALAIVSGVKKFHEYVFGRDFEIVTDHRPLLGLLAGDRPTPVALSPRLTRWTIFLAAYSYKLLHRPGKELGHADALSRCPLPATIEDPTPGTPVLLIDSLDSGPVTSKEVARASYKDITLRTVMGWVQRGWPAAPANSNPSKPQDLSEFQRHQPVPPKESRNDSASNPRPDGLEEELRGTNSPSGQLDSLPENELRRSERVRRRPAYLRDYVEK
ncbi:uncharacterized protein LOC131203099 [Ahaetulla prasina]|uniref:uncharacterized protein LOC131203099 n=1 Tax=Ahaetulla prasina TaxID=499056 RepID=UPI002649CC4E|nr:uncharacterized protein LOC131203099 [Ahaetulla prasina]